MRRARAVALSLLLAGAVTAQDSRKATTLTDVDLSRSDIVEFLAKRVEPGRDKQAIIPETAAASGAPKSGLGLMFYFRDARVASLAHAEMKAADVHPTRVGGRTLTFRGDIPLSAFSARSLSRVVYVGEVPAPDRGEEGVPFNERAAVAHRVRALSNRHGVFGDGVVVGLWDVGKVRIDHIEFRNGRATQQDDAAEANNHSTHVAGTIAAHGDPQRGGRPEARGMAPKARLLCHDLHDDVTEMRAARAKEVVCSNHSYGQLRGWESEPKSGWAWYGNPGISESEDVLFGRYSGRAQEFDALIHEMPGLIVFVAAGNDRDDAGPPPGTEHWVRRGPGAPWTKSTEHRMPDGATRGGYDTIAGFNLAKNVITIGAIREPESPGPDGIRVAPFSGWGPTDDGRIKPDLVAHGWGLVSPDAHGPNSYDEKTGTSMASPTATGTCALLVELWRKKRKQTPRSDEIKAVLIHTAMSPLPGPSASIGWGSIRADEAGEVVADVKGEKATILRGVVTSDKREFVWAGRTDGKERLRATLVWVDPPGEPVVSEEPNDARSVLVHDLDLQLQGPDDSFYPWTLEFRRQGPGSPETIRQDRKNAVDNVERVDVPANKAAKGAWRVQVTAARLTPEFKEQAFALVISGLNAAR